MQHPLTDGQSVDVVGQVGRRSAFATRNGPAVKATLHAQGSSAIRRSGPRQGKVRMFNGAPEIHARQTMVDRNKPPEDELVALGGAMIRAVESGG